VPRNRGPVPTLLTGLSLAGMSSAMTVEGGTDTAMFAPHLDHFLLPALSPEQMVVVDNVGAHKPDRIRELVDAAGCELVFLPAYSPHLCPIEEAFSKLKALIRAAAARTWAALDAAIPPPSRLSPRLMPWPSPSCPACCSPLSSWSAPGWPRSPPGCRRVARHGPDLPAGRDGRGPSQGMARTRRRFLTVRRGWWCSGRAARDRGR